MFEGVRRLLSAVTTLVATVILVGSVAVLLVVFYYSKDLPDYDQLAEYNPATVTRLYASDGSLIAEYAKERRLFVPINAIPKQIIQAFIAAEDKNFYQHPGIDVISIGRAAIQNLMNYGQGKPLVGGSTITQQVVKNFLLTKEQSFDRKVKEAILSFRITQVFSKDRILELYLNEIYLGGRSYGVAAASLSYFNKSIDELTVEEAALLAGMPKAPSTYSPTNNYDGALKRRNYVLERMYEDGFITRKEYTKAVETPIVLHQEGAQDAIAAEFFSEAVRRQLLEMQGEKNLYEGGLAVRTTIEPALQKVAEKALQDGLNAYDRRHGWRGPITRIDLSKNQWQQKLSSMQPPAGIGSWKLAVVLGLDEKRATIGLKNGKTGVIPHENLKWARKWLSDNAFGPSIKKPSDVLKVGDVIFVSSGKDNQYILEQMPSINGALVAMDPHTGKVLAMMGGYEGEKSQFNRAIQAKRQPGSAFKTFVYLAGLEQGFTPASIIVDAPIEFDQGDNMPAWRPKNYSGEYYGPSTLRIGLERSRNAMTVRLAQAMGLNHVADIAKRFNIYEKPPMNYSMVLGAAEVSLLDLTNAYSMLVNGGKRVVPSLIERIQDRNGSTIFRRDSRECIGCVIENADTVSAASIGVPVMEDIREQVIDPLTAYQIVSILEGVVKRGTGMQAREIGRTLGGKTGTTNDSYDTWFMGFSPDLVVGVYVGFDNPHSMGKHETGASVSLPIWISFMEQALEGKTDIPFRIPPGIKLVRIDKSTGLLAAPTTPKKEIILEAFKPDTEPKGFAEGGVPPISGSDNSEDGGSFSNGPSTVGTGGIY